MLKAVNLKTVLNDSWSTFIEGCKKKQDVAKRQLNTVQTTPCRIEIGDVLMTVQILNCY